jgi:hypothetical protein
VTTQSEYALEEDLIQQLEKLDYERVQIDNESAKTMIRTIPVLTSCPRSRIG